MPIANALQQQQEKLSLSARGYGDGPILQEPYRCKEFKVGLRLEASRLISPFLGAQRPETLSDRFLVSTICGNGMGRSASRAAWYFRPPGPQ
ncbi:hypothetical protein QU481_04710 [Crenobacter sp. SG2303]|uniref:Uncharacterized protein n=1 Tax=Crenobacter oryzisoli TaxID=3056844 RepID=A0ABT7XK85_9NEIS|nr:hypothetical protein [Crenobacter sp. SG2303]MDN0074190.1 hypothetical protein [Crenobacter sp. SG2303]